MLVEASLGLGTMIVTELTVLELRDCAYRCGFGIVDDELMRGMARTSARSSSLIRIISRAPAELSE